MSNSNNYGKIKDTVFLDIDTIRKKVSDYDIFRYYIHGFQEVGVKFTSELRPENIPSAVINYYKGRLRYYDFGSIDRSMDCYDYVRKKYGLSLPEVLRTISTDFKLGLVPPDSPPSMGYVGIKLSKEKLAEMKPLSKNNIKILKKTKEFSKQELEWWETFGWTKETLDLYKVISCRNIIVHLNEMIFTFTSSVKEPCYIFDYENNIYKRKMYRPNSKHWKWFSSSNISSIIQGEKQLDETGDILIITSSLKDVGTLRRIGYNAVAPASENTMLTIGKIEEYKQRFEFILTYFDNDDPGIKSGEKYFEEFDIPYIHNDIEDPKDPSDLYKKLNDPIKFIEYVDRRISEVGG